VLENARTHTHTTWVLDVSQGVGRTTGKLEEFRSTKELYTCQQCGPNLCTKFICLYRRYAGSRLRVLMIWANCLFPFIKSFLLRIIEDVTTISKL